MSMYNNTSTDSHSYNLNSDHHLLLALIGLVSLLSFFLFTLMVLFLCHQPFRQEFRRLCRLRSPIDPHSHSIDSSKDNQLSNVYMTDLPYSSTSSSALHQSLNLSQIPSSSIPLPTYPTPLTNLQPSLSHQSPIPSSIRHHPNHHQSYRPSTATTLATTLRPSTGNTFKSKNSIHDLKKQISRELNPKIREPNPISPIDLSVTSVEWYSQTIETRPRVTSSGSGKVYDILPCPAHPLKPTRPLSLGRTSPPALLGRSSPPTLLGRSSPSLKPLTSTQRLSTHSSLEPQPDLEVGHQTFHTWNSCEVSLGSDHQTHSKILDLNNLTIESTGSDQEGEEEIEDGDGDVDDGISLESDEFYHRRRRNQNQRRDTANTIIPGN